MISLAAATTIQKIADSNTAMIISYKPISIVWDKKSYANYRSFPYISFLNPYTPYYIYFSSL